ncbi:hypothetical protein E5288_WYG010041 [Bos mutus]|uniref:Uncharacterized protein n=1 Tax=Bos mutus TaxID=72004 RepID=A0A6B0S1S9_9CETA|nr:hypothetical protein [Bos mutus]
MLTSFRCPETHEGADGHDQQRHSSTRCHTEGQSSSGDTVKLGPSKSGSIFREKSLKPLGLLGPSGSLSGRVYPEATIRKRPQENLDTPDRRRHQLKKTLCG